MELVHEAMGMYGVELGRRLEEETPPSPIEA